MSSLPFYWATLYNDNNVHIDNNEVEVILDWLRFINKPRLIAERSESLIFHWNINFSSLQMKYDKVVGGVLEHKLVLQIIVNYSTLMMNSIM